MSQADDIRLEDRTKFKRVLSFLCSSFCLCTHWGIATGFVIAVTGIATSAYLVVHGHDVSGTILGGSTFAGLVSTFIYGTSSRKEERVKKAEIMQGSPKAKTDN